MRGEFRRAFTQPFQRINELDAFGWRQDFGQFFYVLSVQAEHPADEIAAFRRQVDYPNSAIGSALGPGYQALFVKAIDGGADRTWGKKDLRTDRIHR
jgi:hypothetical protein